MRTIVATTIRRYRTTERSARYSRSWASFSAHVMSLRMRSWAKPVNPGRTTRRRRPPAQPLPVLRELFDQLLEEDRADRPRPDDRHVAAQHVPQLGQLVELGRAQHAPDRRVLR